MDKNIYEILNKIEKCGFEAYIVGGYVRDYLLGIKSYDIDICTNALPKDDLSLVQLVGELTQGLVHGFHRIQFGHFHRHVSGAGLAHFH